jgi:hypothetical protein
MGREIEKRHLILLVCSELESKSKVSNVVQASQTE